MKVRRRSTDRKGGRAGAVLRFCAAPRVRAFARTQVNTICAGTYVRFSDGKLGRFRKQPFLDVSPWWERDFPGCENARQCKQGERGRMGKGKTGAGEADGDWVGAAVELPPPSGNREKIGDGSATAIPTTMLPFFPSCFSPFPFFRLTLTSISSIVLGPEGLCLGNTDRGQPLPKGCLLHSLRTTRRRTWPLSLHVPGTARQTPPDEGGPQAVEIFARFLRLRRHFRSGPLRLMEDVSHSTAHAGTKAGLFYRSNR